jgi:hypothetical protein
MIAYILRHWRGELSMPLAFLVNGVVGFAAINAMFFAVDALSKHQAAVLAALTLSAVWLIWAAVGIARTGLRIVRTPGKSVLAKVMAVAAVAVTVLCFALAANDIWMIVLAPLFPG